MKKILIVLMIALCATIYAAQDFDALMRARYERDCKTEKGRREWHGRCVSHITDAATGEIVTTYEDGTTFRDNAVKVETPQTQAKALHDRIIVSTNGVPARLAELRRKAAQDARRTNRVNQTISTGKWQ